MKRSSIPSLKELIEDNLEQYTDLEWEQTNGDIMCSVDDVPYEVLTDHTMYGYEPERLYMSQGKMWISWSLDD